MKFALVEFFAVLLDGAISVVYRLLNFECSRNWLNVSFYFAFFFGSLTLDCCCAYTPANLNQMKCMYNFPAFHLCVSTVSWTHDENSLERNNFRSLSFFLFLSFLSMLNEIFTIVDLFNLHQVIGPTTSDSVTSMKYQITTITMHIKLNEFLLVVLLFIPIGGHRSCMNVSMYLHLY